jgi:hypothetical protein
MLKLLADRLTYANVVATLALFSGIGGASYAAITLPANSVGPAQLRPGAVGLGALSIPLGTAGITDDKGEDLTKNGCNGGGFSGTPLQIAPRLAVAVQPLAEKSTSSSGPPAILWCPRL